MTLSARGASWGSKKSSCTRSTGGPLWRVNADGSDVSVLTDKLLTTDERSHRWPVFLPDGDRFLFWAGHFTKDGAKSGRGYVFCVDEQGQQAMQPFDPDTGHVTGDDRVIAGAVGFQPALYWGAFAVSATGTVVTNPTSAVFQSLLTWYDRSGKELGIVGRPAMMYNPSLSPEGQRLAAVIADPRASNVDVWTFDLRAGTSGRFTFGPLEEASAVWVRITPGMPRTGFPAN